MYWHPRSLWCSSREPTGLRDSIACESAPGNKISGDRIADRPAHDLAAEENENDGRGDPSLLGAQVRDVGHPFSIQR